MDAVKVFIIPFHVKRMDKSIMPPDLLGAYVSCYAAGKDYVEATKKSLEKLLEDGLHPQEILHPINQISSSDWTRHVNEKWHDQQASLPTQNEFDEAIRNGRVIYGPFGSYA